MTTCVEKPDEPRQWRDSEIRKVVDAAEWISFIFSLVFTGFVIAIGLVVLGVIVGSLIKVFS